MVATPVEPILQVGSCDVDVVSPDAPVNSWLQALKQHQTIAIAGVAIAVGSAGLAKILTQPISQHEGRFYLTTSAATSATDTVAVATQSQSYSAIAPPTINLEQRMEVLTSRTMLESAIAQLQAEGINIDYTSLVNRLKIAPTNNPNVVEVSYHTNDAKQLQAVLETMSEVYTNDNESCIAQACHKLEFIEMQMSSIQTRITALQANVNQFQQQHQISKLQAQQQQTLALKTQLNQRIAQNRAKLEAARKQVNQLTLQLGQQAYPFSAKGLLMHNTRYQVLMEQLRSVENSIAEELQQPQIRQNHLQPLYAQYQALLAQLKEETNTVSNHFILNYVIGQPTPLTSQLSDVKQWVEVTHQVEILSLHQQTLDQLNRILNQRTSQPAIALEQYAHLQRQLDDANELLEQYSAERQYLEALTGLENSWNLVAPPEVLQPEVRQHVEFTTHPGRSVGLGLLLGALLGVGVAAITDRRDDSRSEFASHRHPFLSQ
ncbi:hypothetical protein H6G89_05855 [Oscillatoria sp. FACHB-1407]|uniref:hypothetical protein n=1 Tax=Oscillatoria sp. FACHB-1407 TaxID=2692847 RepID=UPI00168286E4|nr:hypothetical protein [Oscillatoria sp. FACHB-1407]MBD2460564.1 hypothetical protein [Oscillatoria sp. FACHB-1407]